MAGGSNDPTATRSSPASSSVSLQAGGSQAFVAALSDADCDLNYAEWYLDGTLVNVDQSPQGCSSSTTWTRSFPSTGTFEVALVVYDNRNDGNHVGWTNWFVSVTPGDPAAPGDCAISGTTLRFSGRDWTIFEGQRGPGNPVTGNTWKANNVACDADGHLVLKITFQDGVWTTAEVSSVQALAFGTYEWKVKGRVDDLDRNVVLGLFNYGGVDEEDEIDIELTRWGSTTNPNGNYVVYPNTRGPGFTKSTFDFDLAAGDRDRSTHTFSWQRNQVSFQSFEGTRQLGNWTYAPAESASLIPQDPLKVYMNLWLVGGNAPSNGASTQVVIESFSWQP